MSLLRNDRLLVGITPTQVGIIQITGWRRPQIRRTVIDASADGDVPNWRSALQELDAWLAERKLRHTQVTLVLSNRFVRFALVPWSDEIKGMEEQRQLALACFEPRYGDMTGWTVRHDPVGYGEAQFSCAVEAGLIEAIRDICRRRGLICRGMRPAFATAWNRHRREGNKASGAGAAIFAMAESGTLVIGTRWAANWHSVRALMLPAEDAMEILIEREALLQGFAELPPVWRCVPGGGPSAAGGNPQVWPLSAMTENGTEPALMLAFWELAR